MPTPPVPSTRILRQHLFPASDVNTYAVLDGASIEGLLDELAKHDPPHTCLYSGHLEPDLAECAPYLVQLTPEHPFTDYVLSGWGKHWGIFAHSAVDITTLRRHFRRFLKAKSPEGKTLIFRYYDPRVMSVYLPTCNPSETAFIFGPVLQYLLEADAPLNLLCFSAPKGIPASFSHTLL